MLSAPSWPQDEVPSPSGCRVEPLEPNGQTRNNRANAAVAVTRRLLLFQVSFALPGNTEGHDDKGADEGDAQRVGGAAEAIVRPIAFDSDYG